MKDLFLSILVGLFLVACGQTGTKGNQGPGGSGSELTDLQNVPPTQAPNLIAAFGYSPSNYVGALVAFYSNNRYFSGVAQELDSQLFRVAGTIGYYEENRGVIQTTGEKTTCISLAEEYKGKATVAGSVSSSAIAVTTGATSVVLDRIDPNNLSSPQLGMVVQWGCFDQITGAFSPQSWTDF